ncbi:MAG: ABC transporter ATP-binding protein, partial [Miltoncostaeaceae bacterium]
LVRAIAGLVRHAGTVELNGLAGDGARRAVARTLAVVAQNPITPGYMRVRDYVALGRTPHLGLLSPAGPNDRRAVERALGMLDVGAFAERALSTLSGGERQRVVLARAVAQEAPILLLDEPTTALDLGRQQQVLDLVQRLRSERGLTVISTLHDLSLAALHGDRVVLMSDGGVACEGPPRDVLTSERLSHAYGVPVRVVDIDGVPTVVPARLAT